MQIQFNTDNNISGTDQLKEKLSTILTDDLSRFKDKITRLEVHLSDENGKKSVGKDKRCMLEARVENLKPIAVTSDATNIEQAVITASEKLAAALTTTLGKIRTY
ncbi:MAG: HPF/RaiA family ribosome-associated protein [Vicingaceae bacterium]|nr:HPF/RaiA family ribosome-associated protein [Vicingaceae bacterium]